MILNEFQYLDQFQLFRIYYGVGDKRNNNITQPVCVVIPYTKMLYNNSQNCYNTNLTGIHRLVAVLFFQSRSSKNVKAPHNPMERKTKVYRRSRKVRTVVVVERKPKYLVCLNIYIGIGYQLPDSRGVSLYAFKRWIWKAIPCSLGHK